MRFAVESWSPDYGAPIEGDQRAASAVTVDPSVEVPIEHWTPRSPSSSASAVDDLVFVDGVRRVEAHVWVTDDAGEVRPGLCASYAAGAVHCNSLARVVEAQVERTFFSSMEAAESIRTRHAEFAVHVTAPDTDEFSLLLQRRMAQLEGEVAAAAGPAQLVVVDGPLRGGHVVGDQEIPAFVGYVKTHQMTYGPPVVREVVTRLAIGQRTPLLQIGDVHPRLTWYQRLPGPSRHGWAGVVRLETSAAHRVADVAFLADRLCQTLGRFASSEQKDPARAPQNLYPVGALERDLRRRLGDPAIIFRALRAAAVGR